MSRTRAEQSDRATQEAFYASRRPRRPKILQVPTFDATPSFEGGTGRMRPVVVPFKPTPISGAEARRRGEAYARVLDGYPKYDAEFESRQRARNVRAAEQRQQGIKRLPRLKRDPRGTWWMNKLADAVDARLNITVPSYRARGERRRRPLPVEHTFAGDNSKFRSKHAR